LIVFGLLALIVANKTWGQDIPIVSSVGRGEDPSTDDLSITLQILFLLTVLTLLPSILLMTTAFIRISIVLGMLRRAIGTQQTPSNQIIIGLSLFMTFFIMSPVIDEIYTTAIKPYYNSEIAALEPGEVDPYGNIVQEGERILKFQVMLMKASLPIREFMWLQIGIEGSKDVGMFMQMARMEKPNNPNEVPMQVLIPAFMTSELKKAFMMGFMIFIPFLILDIVTSSVLISMGMFQLPPAFISLPFKILLFVMVDGWSVLIKALGDSFYQNMVI
jgi:flagellar biosynthetic protein FliP